MREAQTLGFHNPVDHRARSLAAKAVIEILAGLIIMLGVAVIMERTAKGIIFALLLELVALAAYPVQ